MTHYSAPYLAPRLWTVMNLAQRRSGLGIALMSSAAFGTSGSFATALIGSGWSPAAAVTVRLLVASAALTVPALLLLRGRLDSLVRQARSIGSFGVIAIAAGQLCYFNAVARLSVGVSLLLEYLGILLVVGWLWVRQGQRPRRLTVSGAVAALIGLGLVLDITGHQHLDPIGVLWGLGAAVGLATYFVISAEAEAALPPIAMAWAGMAIGALTLLLIGLAGLVPLHASTADVRFLHHRMSWLVPVLGISLLAAVYAYSAGIRAARLLGAKLASFAGLSEVLFAVLFAWLLLGQLPRLPQLVGGLFIVAGVALVQLDELRGAPAQPVEAGASAVLVAGQPS
jgi:drug/metabolite transporter (DMT)-like permease